MRATPTEWRAGVGRLGVDDQRERLGDAVEALVVGALHAVLGLEGADHACGSMPPSAPRTRGRGAVERSASTSAGSNQVPRRSARDVERGARAAGAEEHLDGLGEAEDAAEQRDRVAGQAVGVAARRPSARRGCGSPSAVVSDSSIMRAMSAPRSQRSSVISRAPSAPLRAIAASRRVRPWRRTWRSDARRALVVDQLAGALELEVVGAEQRAEPGGVARAAGVLEQQRVEERRARRRASSPISSPMRIPIAHERTAWPIGWPSVTSSA